jgi:phosphoserine phosphatase RsbX
VKLAGHFVSLPKRGLVANGDAVLFRPDRTPALFAVIDGVGHGEPAAHAARLATDELEAAPSTASVTALVARLHDKLKGTRGAAAMVCLVESHRMQACSVGNVELRSLRGPLAVVPTPGILGSQHRTPRVFEGRIEVGERLVLFTDGISSRLRVSETRGVSVVEACGLIMASHRRDSDDATVLVVDVEATPPFRG